MTQRKPPKIGPETPIRDINLDEEEVYYHGERLTEARAEELARETLDEARRRNLIPGRKSLSGGTTHSPRIQFRVPQDLRAEAERRAAAEGKSVSVLAREALEHYLRAG